MIHAESLKQSHHPIERLVVKGVQARTEILVDQWGVPHIYATTLHDAFFAQGWNAARDRLWQIDLWRRKGLGELAAAFGSRHVDQDRAIRLFMYRGDMDKEWAAYGTDARGHVEAFVAGINAYVAAVKSNAALMPLEFSLAGYEPAFWKAEDIVRVRNHCLVYGGVTLQLINAQIACKAGGLTTDLPSRISPPWTPVVPEGLDLCSIPPDVLEQYHLARNSVVFGPRFDHGNQAEGSNNWVVSPSKSATGRAILAGDPHRSLDIPSMRYLVHIVAPGLDVVGAGQPALPGIEIGHNGKIAFGLTAIPIAHEDLYVYETHPQRPNEYRYRGEWELMRVVLEPIAVRGAGEIRAELKFTRHGPVVMEDPAHRRAYVVRAAWLDTGGAPYLAAMRYLQAGDVDEFAAALKHWGTPGENHVCADTSGRIGWFPAGLTPLRSNSDGLLPLPGDGRYEWGGYLDRDLLPSEVDPPRGYIATANEMNLPKDYPYSERRVTFTWADRARFERISAVLAGKKSVSLEDCKALQNDYLTIPGGQLVRVLSQMSVRDEMLRDTVEWLAEWDAEVNADSAQAALFEVWYARHLVPAVLARVVPEAPESARAFVEPMVVAQLLAEPDQRLGPDPELSRDELMLTTLAKALEEVEQRLGLDRSKWQWGKLSTILFEHPLAELTEGPMRQKLSVGPAPKSGDGSTVGLSFYRTEDFRVLGGASVRMVLDVGDWDNSQAVNAPGQSGDPSSPHYRDLLPLWLDGKYFPLAYSRAAVERVTRRKILLEPGPQ